MRFKTPVRGVHIGKTCIDGSEFAAEVCVHAHTSTSGCVGYICAKSKRDLAEHILHELAHLASDSGHDDQWRRSVRKLGGRVPAAYRKRPRKS